MDTKAAFDREAFEKAAAELTGYKPEFILSQRTGDDYEFGSGLNAYWHFWKASREAIEITLPKEIVTRDHGPMISKERTMAVLAYNGIKVKS